METFDYALWKRDVMQAEQLIRALKDILREPHQPRKYTSSWPKEYREAKIFKVFQCIEQDLIDAKHQATLLYAARAHQRGRVHRKGDTWDAQNELIGAPGCTPDAHKKKAA